MTNMILHSYTVNYEVAAMDRLKKYETQPWTATHCVSLLEYPAMQNLYNIVKLQIDNVQKPIAKSIAKPTLKTKYVRHAN